MISEKDDCINKLKEELSLLKISNEKLKEKISEGIKILSIASE